MTKDAIETWKALANPIINPNDRQCWNCLHRNLAGKASTAEMCLIGVWHNNCVHTIHCTEPRYWEYDGKFK